MKRLVIGFVCLVALVVVVALALPFVISADFVAREVKDLVRERTGRELVLGEDSQFSFYPNFAVELRDVSLSNPQGMAAGEVVAAESLRVRVAVMPLLSGEVHVEEFVLDGPRFNLLVDAGGKSNWALDDTATADPPTADVVPADQEPADAVDAMEVPLDPGEPAAVTDSAEMALQMAPIEIRRGVVRYLDERSGSNFVAEDVNVTLSLADLAAPLSAKGALVWNGQRVAIDGLLRHPTRLAEGGASAIELTVTSALLNAGYNGQLSLENGVSLAGVVSLNSQSVRELMQWAGRPLTPGSGLGPLKAESAIGLQQGVLTLKDANVSLDGMNGQGTIRVEFTHERPKVLATLGIDTVDLNTYIDEKSSAAGASSQGEPSALVAGWSQEPIDLSGLRVVDAELTLNTGAVAFGKLRTGAGGLRVLIEDGMLEMQLNNLSMYGGTAAGNVQLDGSKEVPSLRVAMSANDFDGYALLRDFAGFGRLEGRAATTISVAATGRSQAALVSTLRGEVVFRFTDGAVRGLNVAKMIRNVAGKVVDGWESNEDELTDFSLFEASFHIENGLAANDDLTLLGPLVRVAGEGSIDLPSQRLDYRVDPKLVATLQGQGGKTDLEGFSVPIVVKGPWDAPKIYPDLEGILKDPQAAYQRFKGLVSSSGDFNIGVGGSAIGEALGGAIGEALGGGANPGNLLGDGAQGLTGPGLNQFLQGLGGNSNSRGTARAPSGQAGAETMSGNRINPAPEAEEMPAPRQPPQSIEDLLQDDPGATPEAAGTSNPAEGSAPGEPAPATPAPASDDTPAAPAEGAAEPVTSEPVSSPVPQTTGKSDAQETRQ